MGCGAVAPEPVAGDIGRSLDGGADRAVASRRKVGCFFMRILFFSATIFWLSFLEVKLQFDRNPAWAVLTHWVVSLQTMFSGSLYLNQGAA